MKTTDEEARISHASDRMCETQRVLQRMWTQFHHEIISHASEFKYRDEKDNIPIGINVVLVLNASILCSESLLNLWKRWLKAKYFDIAVLHNHIKVYFRIEF